MSHPKLITLSVGTNVSLSIGHELSQKYQTSGFMITGIDNESSGMYCQVSPAFMCMNSTGRRTAPRYPVLRSELERN